MRATTAANTDQIRAGQSIKSLSKGCAMQARLTVEPVFNIFDEQMFVENLLQVKARGLGSVLLLVNMIDGESALDVLPVYGLVQRTVQANQTHLGLPTCALEIALLIVAAISLLRGRHAPLKQRLT